MTKLRVELYGTIIGELAGDDRRSIDFTVSDQALERFGVNSPVLSVSIPLQRNQPRGQSGRRGNWFRELLPEGDQYEYMLAQRRLRSGDTLGFLAAYGRDIAGAVQLWDPTDPFEPREPSISPVTDGQVRRLLEDPVASPLANQTFGGKSSIGGVQPKIVLVWTERGWAQALDGYPSTHILKPEVASQKTLIFDEEYGIRLANRLGLAPYEARIAEFDGLAALQIERFDRANGARIHQEDFNQVLGAQGIEKYQEFGGKVTLKRVAQSLIGRTPRRDLQDLARMVILSVAIGNLYMHAKNTGQPHLESGRVRLAPAYDMVPHLRLAGNDGRMALAINGKYVHANISTSDIETELQSWRLPNVRKMITETLENILEVVHKEEPDPRSQPLLRDDLYQITASLLAGQPIGKLDH